MATLIPLTKADPFGEFVTPTLVSAASEMEINLEGRVTLFVDNSSGADVTVTMVAQAAPNSNRKVDQDITVADGELMAIGEISKDNFASIGKALVNFSSTSSIAVFALSK